MPAHDWRRKEDGTFHDLHQAWIASLRQRLNGGVLPKGYYAMSEQRAGDIEPDVAVLQRPLPVDAQRTEEAAEAGILVMPPPRARITSRSRNLSYVKRQDSLVIRHRSGNKIVALVELISRGNKASRDELESFIRKAQACFQANIHLTLVDLHPPGRLDPHGMHAAIWETRGEDAPTVPAEKPLQAVSYEAGDDVTAYVEPFAAGECIPDAPLFLHEKYYVTVPFEETYMAAFSGFSEFMREEIETGRPAT